MTADLRALRFGHIHRDSKADTECSTWYKNDANGVGLTSKAAAAAATRLAALNGRLSNPTSCNDL
jgi:hypothetical protein